MKHPSERSTLTTFSPVGSSRARALRTPRVVAALTTLMLSAIALLLTPALAAAITTGSISGTVTSASSGEPIAGIAACAYTATTHEYRGCAYTTGSGAYTISGLEAGSYKVEFHGTEYEGGGYVAQWYNGKASFEAADSVGVTAGNTTSGINAALQEKVGRISGTVTDATTGAPINGIEVCASPVSTSGEYFWYYYGCAHTDASGNYTIAHLSPGSYKVGFFSPYKWNETTEESELEGPNYVSQFYNGKAHREEADSVAVSEGSTTAGINAAMQPGATITGTVTDATTGAALEGVSVCAWGSIGARCDTTDATGHYAVQTVPSGSYKVEFDPEHWYTKYNKAEPEKEHWQRSEHPLMDYLRQYYNDKFSFDAAEAITATGGATVSGIDAKMTKEVQPPPPAGTAIAASKATVKGGKAQLKLTCPGPGACTGAVTLRARPSTSGGKKKARASKGSRPVVIGRAHFSIPAGKSKIVAVKLTAKGNAMLAATGKKGLKAQLSGTGLKSRTVTLKGNGSGKKAHRG